MLTSTFNLKDTSFNLNSSFSTQNISSTVNRPRSSKTRKMSSRKSLTPLDPKLYRIAHAGFNHNKKPPIKKKRKKRVIPFSSSSTQAHSHHDKTLSPKGKPIEIKRTPKFVSMKTFDVVKRSWSRKDDSIVKETGLVQIRENKKRKTKSVSQHKQSNQAKPHFSDVGGMSKRKAKSTSNHKTMGKSKRRENNNQSSSSSALIKKKQSPVNTHGSQAPDKNSVPLPQIVPAGSYQSVKTDSNNIQIEGKGQTMTKKKMIATPKTLSPASKEIADQTAKKQHLNEKDNEKGSVRSINNSFTFGKEPNSHKQEEISAMLQPISKGKLPSLNTKGVTNNKIPTQSNQVSNTQLQTNKTMPHIVQINASKEKKTEKKGKPNVLHLSSNFGSSSTPQKKDDAFPDKFCQSELQEISNVTKVNISSVIYNNMNINAEIQKSMNELIDNSMCVYCLKRVNHPLTLDCSHEVCRNCGDEIVSLSQFTKVSPTDTRLALKCPKCKAKTKIASSIEDLERRNWRPIELNETEKALEKIQVCEICPSSKQIRDIAEFECLNCDILLCYECRIRHLANIRHQSHKVIQYHKIIQEKVELTLCDEHHEPRKLFCLTDSCPICVICANYESEHKEHNIQTTKNVIDAQSILLAAAIREREGQIKLFEELINHLTFAVGKLEEEKASFLEKMNKIYAEIYEKIRKQEETQKNEVNKIFEGKLASLNNKLKNFTYIKRRYEYYRNLICEKDIDIIDRVTLMTKLNHNIDKIDRLAYLKVRNYSQSLADSQLTNIPIKDISDSMSLFKFLPITDVNIAILVKVFSSSNIIKKDMIFTDLVLLLPKIKSGMLLYQTSRDGSSPKLFHEKCDNKGPTLTFVKTDEHHVFGGFNPMSWISESMYNETDESYLFKLGYGSKEKGVKCPVKKYMKHHAIKQNEEGYSPGFGEVDSADLFISYKNLRNSYSNLGKVYKTPKGYDPNCFFAGKSSNWDITEVEVYAVEVMNEEEYYKVVLS